MKFILFLGGLIFIVKLLYLVLCETIVLINRSAWLWWCTFIHQLFGCSLRL